MEQQQLLDQLNTYMLFDEITSISAKDIIQFLLIKNYQKMDSNIIVNSPGGECQQGFSIINFMKSCNIDISTICVGSVCSMGTAIAIAGTKGQRIITKNTDYMVHTFSGWATGNSHDLLVHANQNKKMYNKLLKHYQKYTKLSEKQVKDIVLGHTDRYLTPKECLKYGFVDEVREYI